MLFTGWHLFRGSYPPKIASDIQKFLQNNLETFFYEMPMNEQGQADELEVLNLADKFINKVSLALKKVILADKEFVRQYMKFSKVKQQEKFVDKLLKIINEQLKEFPQISSNVKAWLVKKILSENKVNIETDFIPEALQENEQAIYFIQDCNSFYDKLMTNPDGHIPELVSIFPDEERDNILRNLLLEQDIPAEFIASKLVKKVAKKSKFFENYKEVLINALLTYQEKYYIELEKPALISDDLWKEICTQAKAINMQTWQNPEEFGNVEATLKSEKDKEHQLVQAMGSSIRNVLENSKDELSEQAKALLAQHAEEFETILEQVIERRLKEVQDNFNAKLSLR